MEALSSRSVILTRPFPERAVSGSPYSHAFTIHVVGTSQLLSTAQTTLPHAPAIHLDVESATRSCAKTGCRSGPRERIGRSASS
jgi:hypothetical protein